MFDLKTEIMGAAFASDYSRAGIASPRAPSSTGICMALNRQGTGSLFAEATR